VTLTSAGRDDLDPASPAAAPAPAPRAAADSRGPTPPFEWLRRAAAGLYLAVLGWHLVRRGVPLERAQVLAWIMVALVITTVGRPGGGARAVVKDWVPLGVVLAAYDLSRGISDTLGMPIQKESLVGLERLLFGGTVPSVWAQERLDAFTGPTRWWELPIALLYFSHFVTAFILLGVLWARRRDHFKAFRRRFLTLTAAGLATYMLLPGAPPWMASRDGLIGPIQRGPLRGFRLIGVDISGAFIRYGARFSNPVAALPSLHVGWAAIIALYLCRLSPRWAWPLLALYPLGMGVALVVAGEHYVVDVTMGMAYALVVMLGWNWWERRRAEPVR